jgi:hypothetical protein
MKRRSRMSVLVGLAAAIDIEMSLFDALDRADAVVWRSGVGSGLRYPKRARKGSASRRRSASGASPMSMKP